MKVAAILGMGLALAASTAFTQETKTYHPKKANRSERKPAKIAPPMKTQAATSDASKELHRIEQQSAKSPGGAKASGPKYGAGSAGLPKADRTKPVPPINATTGANMGTSTKGASGVNQGKNPYRGRLRQKGSHQ